MNFILWAYYISNNSKLVKIIHNRDNLPPLIQSFLAFTTKWKKKYNIKINSVKNVHTLILKENGPNSCRKIIISISQKPVSYSIELLEPHTNGNGTKEYKKMYRIEEQGNNNIEDIIRETDLVLNGKKTFKFKPSFPL